ncbi:uncharacterized protein LOC142164119 [Nicotiana tabacum]|uniref:Uncharacterized protein LOC142164119 n=1 Tax=Nicotiana tabacum TaxID=4097 RepID=A0AC58RXC5_TOBAC
MGGGRQGYMTLSWLKSQSSRTSSVMDPSSLQKLVENTQCFTQFLGKQSECYHKGKGFAEATIDELVGNLKTYEMNKNKDNERRDTKREKNLVLKTGSNDSGGEDADMAYLTKQFQKMVHKNLGIPKRGSSSNPKGYDLCHKCGMPGHFIKDCPLLNQDQYKHNTYKAAKRNPVPDKHFKRKNVADNVVKQALSAWVDYSCEPEEDDDQGDNSMMALESKTVEYDSIFFLMAQSDNDKDDDDDESRCSKKSEEKEALIEKVANIDHERDDQLVVVVDLKDIIEELKGEGRHEIIQKVKEVADETHLRLEDEIKSMKSGFYVELEKNKQLQEELGRVKSDLEKSLKWTWSSEAIISMYTNSGGNSKYITVPENWLCTHCGNTGHYKDTCKAKFQYQQKNKVFANKGKMKGRNQQWYIDSGCSKHMTGRKQGEFVSKICTVTNLVTGEVVLVAKRYKNIYIADFESLENGDLSCLSDVDDDAELWHRRLGHASFMLLNKLVTKDLVRGLPNSSFKNHKVCGACVIGKQVRCSFKPKRKVSTSRPFDLFHIDLCGTIRVPSRGGKKYVFVIVDDYSRFTWTLFLRSKDDTFEVFVEFVKMIQVKMSHNVVSIRSDHGTKFDNAKFDEFCAKNGISHNFQLQEHLKKMVSWRGKIGLLRTWLGQCSLIVVLKKEALGKFDAKSDEGIFLGYSSQSKAYKNTLLEKNAHDKAGEDGEQSNVPGKVIDMENRMADMSKESHSEIPGPSHNKVQVSNWKHKSSHPLDNVITPLDSGIQTRSKARNALSFSAFFCKIEPKNIKEALKDADWITNMQELHQFERNSI